MRLTPAISLSALLAAAGLYAATPVAKWDVVPNQRFKGVFNAGVVAFHESALEVAFSVNGKAAHTAIKKELNPRTGVTEYVFPVDSALYGDRKLVITAEVKANGGEALSLPPLTLYSNQKGTMGSRTNIWVDVENGIDYAEGTENAPVKTFARAIQKCGDGGTVYCKKGIYPIRRAGGGMSRKFWTTICPAPGLSPGDVKIRSGRPATNFLRFKDVDIFIDASGTHDMLIGGEGLRESNAWFDNCRLYNKRGAAAADISPFGNKLTAYVTGGVSARLKNGPCYAKLVRGHKVRQITSEAFSGNDMLVVNSSVVDVDPGTDIEAKPAVFAGCAITPEWLHDIVFYNVKCEQVKGNGLLGTRVRDSAFVNVEITGGGKENYTRFSDRMENVLFVNVQQSALEWDWHQGNVKKPGAYVPVDVRVYGCKARDMYGFPTTDGSQGLLVGEGGLLDDL
ncbi:MAG: hypothetical protein J5807_01930 [Kiritimatiellae bacterium]|nr:hypothetical protein [Kiritimatiellia bacterium]